MPKLYEYMGLTIFFYSNEHEPIHVHARQGQTEGKIEIFVEFGNVTRVRYKEVSGKKPLSPKNKEKFIRLTSALADEIVQSWINYFVLHKKIVSKKITGKL
ncbi:DUF4160 domain-containing protein [Bacteriovorax sp. PP10]|jgi:hypothetical protein|uniref:DUF4160 domain-containing protein n=1 Tax=Bacteriovorax antarcticus TaxID=3088717 RepID=A0ABU5VU69_9BACT|nr:DUF4160 domain-containing protein [Bacteriovorax sp. PP10]MEA9356602.1 DUF4160 domain-containing protein [Bacteriovorax sp. PP10]